MNILIVDDNRANRDLLRRFMQLKSYSVREASSGEQAIDIVQSGVDIDLVLMDVMMPGMNGHETTQLIKEISGDNYLPVIMVTALSTSDALTEALRAGGDDFVSKPVVMDVLFSKITAHLRIRELNQQLKEKNQLLLEHNNQLMRETELIQYFFDNTKKQSFFDPRFIQYYISPVSVFNGDILFVKRRPSGGIYMLLGDFTGHGLSAAMGTLPVAQTFFKMAEVGTTISQMAQEINAHLYNLLPIDMFLAATLIEISQSGDHLNVWSGGLPDGYIVNHNAGAMTAIRSSHMPLGIVDKHEFDSELQSYDLAENDMLYLMTDGIIESTGEDGLMYGTDRVKDNIGKSFDNTVEFLQNDLRVFCGRSDQHDDISIVEIKCDCIPDQDG